MESTTGENIVNLAFQDLGHTRPGESVSTAVMTDGLARLNGLLASLSIEQLMAQTQQHALYNLQAGVARYTFGVGGAFSTSSRPEKAVAWRAAYGAFQAGGLVGTFEELQQASRDGLGNTSSIPSAVGADTASPLINVGVFPTPNSLPGTLEITYWTALTAFVAGAGAVNFPDGWLRMLHFNLAIDLLPRYGRQNIDPKALAANAQNSKLVISDLNRSMQQQTAQAAQ